MTRSGVRAEFLLKLSAASIMTSPLTWVIAVAVGRHLLGDIMFGIMLLLGVAGVIFALSGAAISIASTCTLLRHVVEAVVATLLLVLSVVVALFAALGLLVGLDPKLANM